MGQRMNSTLDGVLLTPLREIETPGGNVLHAMKANDPGYVGFGEAYFSQIEPGAIKPWKRHRRMTLNIVVPAGSIRFVIYDDRESSTTAGRFMDVVLSPENYCRLTVPPMLWMAFQGRGNTRSLLLNVADFQHDPAEADRKTLGEIEFGWV